MLRPILLTLLLALPLVAAPTLIVGGNVRLLRGETLLFQGKTLADAPKGEEFTLLKHDAIRRQAYVGYYRDDGALVAVSAPADAFEMLPTDPWTDLLRGVEAFRDLRPDETRMRLARAVADEQQRALATSIAQRINAVLVAPAGNVPALRDTAAQLAQAGHLSLALPLDEAADRFGVAPTKLDRADVARRVAISASAFGRGRQLLASRKLYAAKKLIDEGLEAEPARADLKVLRDKVDKGMQEADDRHRSATKMRQVPKGEIHALTAIEMGLKACADHPRLRALKIEMQSAFEERTSPPVTAAFVSLAGSGASKDVLTEGHRLYVTRCTECHDLELLDSRSITAWRSVVGGMARRAKIDSAQEQRIIEYITVAQRTLDGQ